MCLRTGCPLLHVPLLPLSLSISLCPHLPSYFLFPSPLSPRDNLSPCSNLPSIHMQNFVPPPILFSYPTPIFPTHEPVSPNQWKFSPIRGKEEAHPSPKTQGTEPAWRIGIVLDISQGREKRPQMITKMLLAAMTTTAIQPQYQGCGGNKINCMFISPAQPDSLKQEEAKKEMPSVLCPSPAREPGCSVAVGLPFPKQPSVVTSLSAEPDSSLVSASFQSVPCAQVRRLNPGWHEWPPSWATGRTMASIEGWLQDPEAQCKQDYVCGLEGGRWSPT